MNVAPPLLPRVSIPAVKASNLEGEVTEEKVIAALEMIRAENPELCTIIVGMGLVAMVESGSMKVLLAGAVAVYRLLRKQAELDREAGRSP